MTQPKLRFKGFDGDWERCKLGEIGEIITGSTPSTQRPEYYDDEKNGMLWVTPTDIGENITTKTEKYLSEKGQAVARVVPKKHHFGNLYCQHRQKHLTWGAW